MSLYAIGDLHLHYQSVLKAPGQLHDRVWKNHEEKFRKNCAKTVMDEDTLVLVGDEKTCRNVNWICVISVICPAGRCSHAATTICFGM